MSPKDVERALTNPVVPDVDELNTLDFDSIADEAEEQLIARGAAYAREYARIEHAPTVLAVNLATVLLALRRQHDDYLGRDYDYRQKAAEVYNQSGIQDKDQLDRLKGNVRYHINNLIRRQLTSRELKRLGLLETSALERQQDRRATNSAIVKAATASSEAASSTSGRKKSTEKGTEVVPAQAVKATADHLRLAHVAANIVGQIDPDVIDDDMTPGQIAKLDEQLAAVESATRRLRRHLKKARSEG
ncbi:hypothetical protein [Streptomyces fractus]|uniref:hypothetical protein n=1 Tax=Streptomyces fractus TaxID=641806 RepID=UPI003CEC662A